MAVLRRFFHLLGSVLLLWTDFVSGASVVVPTSANGIEGNSYTAHFSVPIRYQEIFLSTQFPSTPIVIKELRFRGDSQYGAGQGSFSAFLSRLQVRLSTSLKSPGNLSTRFSDNIGTDEVVAFDNSWTFQTSYSGTTEGPKAFDISIPLTKPFSFDPRKGNLLLEIRNFARAPVVYVHDAVTAVGLVERIFTEDPDANSAVGRDDSASVVEFVIESEGNVPQITSQPQGRVVVAGTGVRLEVGALGSTPLSYQWYFNSQPIDTATNEFYLIGSTKVSDSGNYSISISNSFGQVTSVQANLLVLPDSGVSGSSILPNFDTGLDGNSYTAVFSVPMRSQEIYVADTLPDSAVTITELRFRADTQYGAGSGPFSAKLNRILVRLSTTPRTPENLSNRFADNVGTDEVIVFDGSWTFATTYLNSTNGSKLFDIVLPLQRPFVFDRRKGNLLLDVQNFSRAPTVYVNDAVTNPGKVRRLFNENLSAETAAGGDPSASVVQVMYGVQSSLPAIIAQPEGKSVFSGDNIELRVTALGSGPITYQWFFNDEQIEGATNSTFSRTNALTIHSGTYKVRVSNPYGNVVSDGAVVIVMGEDTGGGLFTVPKIADGTEGNTYTATFAVPIRYQEIYNTADFPNFPVFIRELRFRPDVQYGAQAGAFSTTLSRVQIRLSTSSKKPGTLSNRFNDNIGGDEKIVYDGPWLFSTAYSGPASGPKAFDMVFKLSNAFLFNPRSGSLLLEIRNYSRTPIVYVNDAVSLIGSTQRIFTENPSAENASGGDPSASAVQFVYASVSSPPVIDSQPIGGTIVPGEDFRFEVKAFGSEPMYYQWFRDGAAVESGTNSILALTGVQLEQAGKYSVQITNKLGKLTSDVVTLALDFEPRIRSVIPRDVETVEGTGWLRFFDQMMRLQEAYQWTEMPKLPIVIKQIRLRPDAGFNTSGSSNVLARVQVRLSTMTKPVGSLGVDFASNVGTNERIVYDGPLTIVTKFDGPPAGPKKADVILNFREFFKYNPADGNLLVELRNYDTMPIPFAHDTVRNDVGTPLRQYPVKSVFSTSSPEVGSASYINEGASIMDLVYSVEPVPPVIETQPKGKIAVLGESVELGVVALGAEPLSYQWRRSGQPLLNETNSVLRMLSVASSDSGSYTVVITNPLGTVTSEEANLLVDADVRTTRTVPSGMEEVEGNDFQKNIGLLGRFQYAYDAVELPSGPIVIKEMRLRPDFEFTNTFGLGSKARVQLRLSTMPKVVAGLTKDFTANVGFDEKVVFNGLVSLNPSMEGSPSGPKEADIVIRFDEFFEYSPAGGSLLVDLRSFDSLPFALSADSVDNFTGNPLRSFAVRTVSSPGAADATEATTATFAAPVISLVYSAKEAAPIIATQPQNQIVVVGTKATLSVKAVGSEPLRYQWSKDGQPLEGATNAVLEMNPVGLAQAGQYSVTVNNDLGNTNSAAATLVVDAEPRIETIFPLGLDVINGSDWRTIFNEPFRIQEAYQASEFPKMPMVIKELSFRPDPDFMYYPVSNYISRLQVRLSTMTKPVAQLSMDFTNNPGTDERVVYDGPISLSTAFEGPLDGPKKPDLTISFKEFFRYDPSQGNLLIEVRSYDRLPEWMTHDAVDNSFAPFPRTYPVKTVLFNGAPEAPKATIERNSASVINLVYSISTNVSPAILLQPQSTQVEKGNDAAFSVTAVGSLPMTYQWYHNEVALAGATNRVLNLTNIVSSQGGFYSVVVSNSFGVATSDNAGLAPLATKTTLRFIDSQTASGGQVLVPIQLIASGSENAIAFSVSWDRRRLIYEGLASIPAIPNVSVNINTNDLSSGRMGFAFALPAGNTFPSGQQLLAQLRFRAYPALIDQTVNLLFIPFPIATEAVDTRARQLPLRQTFGEVSILYKGFEGEVSPRPFSDKRVTLTDWVQVGRFVAGLDTPRDGAEFQRADCAPRDESGDGALTVRDWVQAGRYSAGLDGISAAGGPLQSFIPAPPRPAPQSGDGASIQLANVTGIVGGRIRVPLTLAATGFESALGFSITYDTQALKFVGANTGRDVIGGSLNLNTNLAHLGQVGCALAFSSAFPLAPGKREVVSLEFEVGAVSAGDVPLTFGDRPVVRELANSDAELLPSNFIAGSVQIPVGAPILSIGQGGNNTIIVSWPSTPGRSYQLESLKQVGSASWGKVVQPPVQGVGGQWSVELPWQSGVSEYFRLRSID